MADERVFERIIMTTEQVGQALDRDITEVEVPEWTTAAMREAGQIACVRLRPLSVQQRDDLYTHCSDNGRADGKLNNFKFLRLVVVYGMVEPQMTDEQLAMRAFGVIDRLAKKVMDISGMGRNVAASAAVTF